MMADRPGLRAMAEPRPRLARSPSNFPTEGQESARQSGASRKETETV